MTLRALGAPPELDGDEVVRPFQECQQIFNNKVWLLQ